MVRREYITAGAQNKKGPAIHLGKDCRFGKLVTRASINKAFCTPSRPQGRVRREADLVSQVYGGASAR